MFAALAMVSFVVGMILDKPSWSDGVFWAWLGAILLSLHFVALYFVAMYRAKQA